jgi:GNAT superfamily N-acetyltransferase
VKFGAPVALAAHHVTDGFDCGEASLDDWLKRRALKNEAAGASRTYVVLNGDRVAAYYCLSAGSIAHVDAPKGLRRNMPDPIPVIVLGRLAIDGPSQNMGLGSALLRDAITRSLQAADITGAAALLVHALSEPARRFYLAREFLESPIRPMTLCLMLETARKAQGAAG